MTGIAFEGYLKEKDTAKKAKDENEKEKNTAKINKSKGGKDWKDEEISLLIDMLEEKPCLWDVFDKAYTRRDVKEIAYTEILYTQVLWIQTSNPSMQKLIGSELNLEGK